MEGWVERTLGFSGAQVSSFLSGNFPHRLSREKAKERPRLLESLAGAGIVVFRVLGAVRRVGLFREVAGVGGRETKTSDLSTIIQPPYILSTYEKWFFKDRRE